MSTVALLSPCFWPEVRRGGERLIRDLADGLLADGHSPRLITSHAGRTARVVEEGLPITRLHRPRGGGLMARRGFEDHLLHLGAEWRELGREPTDVAHAFYPTDATVAARWSRQTGRPAVQTYLGAPTRRWLSARRRRLEITLEANAGCTTIAISRASAEVFKRDLGVDVQVIHPGVDLEAFSDGGGRSEDPLIFCAAAADQPQKRIGLLLDAFAVLRRQRPGARLVLSRPADPSLARRLEAAGAELRDVDDRAELIRAYSEAWVTALPSVGEAFGLVLVESLACGTPVVGSRLGAIPEIVDRAEVGRLFDGDESEALAAALLEGLELSVDPGSAAACRARAGAFSLQRSTEAYERLYAELLAAA